MVTTRHPYCTNDFVAGRVRPETAISPEKAREIALRATGTGQTRKSLRKIIANLTQRGTCGTCGAAKSQSCVTPSK